jgi:hypothetical protein
MLDASPTANSLGEYVNWEGENLFVVCCEVFFSSSGSVFSFFFYPIVSSRSLSSVYLFPSNAVSSGTCVLLTIGDRCRRRRRGL